MTVSANLPRAGNPASSWLKALRTYLGISAVGNLLWEALQLPLYTIRATGTVREQAFTVFHCTLGDILIALGTLTLALLILGNEGWPAAGFKRVAAATLLFGIVYTVFSEWLNVVVRASWAYSDWTIVPIGSLRIGLSPLLQWIIVPSAALAITAWTTTTQA